MVRIRTETRRRRQARARPRSLLGSIGSGIAAPVRFAGRQWTASRHRLGRTPIARNALFQFILRVVYEVNDDDATHMAASVAYYAILSLFPLILGVSALIGLIAQAPDRQQDVVDFFVTYLPGSEQFIQDNIQGLVRFRGTLGITAIVGLLWTASAVFGGIARAVNRAWDIHKDRPFYKAKPRQIAMALVIGLLFFVSLALTSAVQWAANIHLDGRSITDIVGGHAVTWLLRVPSFLMTLGIFLAMFKFIPNTETRWGDIWPGALAGAVAFEAAKSFFVFYLDRFANYGNLYGEITSVVVLMFWIYISALIIIIGAEIASEYAKIRQGAKTEGPG